MSRNDILKADSISEIAVLYANDRTAFLSSVQELYTNTVVVKSMSTKTKTGIIISLLCGVEKEFLDKIHSEIDLPEMLKACQALDSARVHRSLQLRLGKLQKERKIKAVQTKIIRLEQLMEEYNYTPLTGTLTSTRRYLVKQWARNIPADKLQYRTYLFSSDGWRELANIIHFNPLDFQLSWFMKYCFEGKDAAPENSLIRVLESLTSENFKELYTKSKLPYECLRLAVNTLKRGLKHEDKLMIVQHESLKVVLWYWRELSTPAGDLMFATRLQTATTEQLDTLTYGKLLDAIMTTHSAVLYNALVSVAENKLRTYSCVVEQPVGILCDASASMQVAINTSSIFASLISVVSKATLQVFNRSNTTVKTPTTVQEAVRLAKILNADESTSPSASLYYYYSKQIPLRTVIVITDEEENTSYNGTFKYGSSYTGKGFFAELWKRYTERYAPDAKLVFISFTNSNGDAQMVRDLRTVMGNSYVDEYVTVHKVDIKNPDLNRLDYILTGM